MDSVTNGISGLEMSGSPECLSSSLEAEQRLAYFNLYAFQK